MPRTGDLPAGVPKGAGGDGSPRLLEDEVSAMDEGKKRGDALANLAKFEASVGTKAKDGSQKSFGLSKAAIRGTIAIIGLLVVWEFVSTFIVGSRLFLAGPSDVVRVLFVDLGNGSLLRNFTASMSAFLMGFAIAIVFGTLLGMVIGAFPRFRDYMSPLVAAGYVTPLLALAPIFILYFGLGIASKVVVVFLMAVFPIIISTAAGVRAVDPDLKAVGTAFDASRLDTFRRVLLPASVPFIMTGIRLGAGRGLSGVIVGELFGARAGLGFMIVQASQVFDTARIFMGVFVFMVLGVALLGGIQYLEKKVAPWAAED